MWVAARTRAWRAARHAPRFSEAPAWLGREANPRRRPPRPTSSHTPPAPPPAAQPGARPERPPDRRPHSPDRVSRQTKALENQPLPIFSPHKNTNNPQPPPVTITLPPIPPVSPGVPPWARPAGYLAALEASTGSVPSSAWPDLPNDLFTLVLSRLPPADVQAALLVCRSWLAGFSAGLASLRPRSLDVPRLAARFPALSRLDLGGPAARRVGDADVTALVAGLPRLASLSLASAEGLTDGGVAALPGLTRLTALSVYNCCRVSMVVLGVGWGWGRRGRGVRGAGRAPKNPNPAPAACDSDGRVKERACSSTPSRPGD